MAHKQYTVIKTTADLVSKTDAGPNIGSRESQLLFGETFTAKEDEHDWAYGTSDIDGYEGYIHKTHLEPVKNEPTHIIRSLGTHIYPEPDLKTRPMMALGFMSRVRISDAQLSYGFVEIEDMGWVYQTHLTKISDIGKDKDILKTAMKFLNAPYLWGGKTGLGLDCSGLVQICLHYAGIDCPRDSHEQALIGKEISESDSKAGDLVFFEGHVGIMTDETNLINATARSMDTRIEPLKDVANHYKRITGFRRVL